MAILGLIVFAAGGLLIALAGWMIWAPLGVLILGLELASTGSLAYFDARRRRR